MAAWCTAMLGKVPSLTNFSNGQGQTKPGKHVSSQMVFEGLGQNSLRKSAQLLLVCCSAEKAHYWSRLSIYLNAVALLWSGIA